MTYAYVCTNYNNAHFTRDAVRTINAGWARPARIVIVDNQSKAEDVAELEQIAAEHANVVLILNDTNTGYFPGLNMGIEQMRALDPDVTTMVVGNNDLEFPADFGERLAEVVADAPGSAGHRALYRDARRHAPEPARRFRHQPDARVRV